MLSPYTGAKRSYTIGHGSSSARLRAGNSDEWQGANGSLTIISVDNYVISGTLAIPGWTYAGSGSPRAINLVGAWSCKLLD